MRDMRESVWATHGPLLIEIGSRTMLVLCYAFFAYNIAGNFVHQPKLSLAFVFLKEFITLAMILVRKPARSFTMKPVPWVIAIACTLLPTFLRAHDGDVEHMAGVVLQVIGVGFAIAGVMSLNQSFGIVPANRGVKTGGPYRWVRHPIYSGYVVSYIGFVLSHGAPMNWLIFAGFLLTLVPRILFEERHLCQSPEYVAFTGTTRWRLIPFVW